MNNEVYLRKQFDKTPGLKEILDKCQQDVQALTNVPVQINYRIKFYHLSTEDLTRIVCEVCEVYWNDVLSVNRKFDLVLARHLYCFFAYTVQKKALVDIAKILGRDHTTIIHARDKVQNMIDVQDELYMGAYLEIEKRVAEIIKAE